jgi:hypothetical protein
MIAAMIGVSRALQLPVSPAAFSPHLSCSARAVTNSVKQPVTDILPPSPAEMSSRRCS